MKKFAIIVAAGLGARMGKVPPKQFLLVQGKPILWYTVNVFLESYPDIRIILVIPENFETEGKAIADLFTTSNISIVYGGATRFESVRNGLKVIEHPSIVFVHDGVRCLVSSGLIQRCFDAAVKSGTAVPVIPVVDSLRVLASGANRSLNRTNIYSTQTPQVFKSEIITQAFEQGYEESFTDEASVVERIGVAIHLVEGEKTNLKVTTPVDLAIVENLLGDRG